MRRGVAESGPAKKARVRFRDSSLMRSKKLEFSTACCEVGEAYSRVGLKSMAHRQDKGS